MDEGVKTGEKMVMVGARVSPEQRARIEARGEAFPQADGSRGNMSIVVRSMFDVAELLYDTARVERVREAAKAAGVPVDAMWPRLVDAGLRAEAEDARSRAAAAAKEDEFKAFGKVIEDFFSPDPARRPKKSPAPRESNSAGKHKA